jgi:hypothetical protein
MAILVPVLKKGIKDDPFNYRGITISSNVCKLGLLQDLLKAALSALQRTRLISSTKQSTFS